MYGTYNRLNLSVWASNRDVIRAANKKLKKSVRFTRTDRMARHQFYRLMLRYHAESREIVKEWRL